MLFISAEKDPKAANPTACPSLELAKKSQAASFCRVGSQLFVVLRKQCRQLAAMPGGKTPLINSLAFKTIARGLASKLASDFPRWDEELRVLDRHPGRVCGAELGRLRV
jgi:hypothetical protein